jgi:hypothetical protein
MKFWLTFSLMSIYAILFWKTPRGCWSNEGIYSLIA